MDRTSEKSSLSSSFRSEDVVVEIGGAQLAVRSLTRATDVSVPTIIFLHDSLGCITVWRDFPEKLAAACNCNALIYDRQGYGKSAPVTEERHKGYLEKEARVLIDLVDHFAIEHPILFGHSDGGTIALLAAGLQPERFSAVVSEGAHVFVEDLSIEGIRKAVELYATTNLKSRLEKYHGDKTDTVFRIWTETWCSAEFRDWNMVPELSKIKCPVLVLQGSEDEYGTVEQVNTIAREVSGLSESHLVAGTAHTPHKHEEQQVIETTAAFLGKKGPSC